MKTAHKENKMDFEKLLSERYSVRSFKAEHLPDAVIDTILHAGHKAPTGCNYQPQRIFVMNTDEEYAKTTIFGKLIAPGVMSFMSVWAKYLEVDFFGEELLAGKSTQIEWLKPVFADDVLTGKATITNLVKRNARTDL